MRPTFSALAVCMVALIGFIAAPLAAQVDQSSTLPSVEVPADVERVLRDYESRWAAGDAAGLAALFTEDGFVLSGSDPHIRGRSAIEDRYQYAGGPLHLRAVDFAVEGDVGFIIGAFAYDDQGDRGKFVLALRRVEGRWYIAADIDNAIIRN